MLYFKIQHRLEEVRIQEVAGLTWVQGKLQVAISYAMYVGYWATADTSNQGVR